MINWVNFLHIYQPPRQNEFIFHQVARESYFEIAKFFDLYDGLSITLNMSGSLLEQLAAYHYDKLLEDFRKAFAAGELELTGSAMYHPILPLLSAGEMERQILLDEKIKKKIFGDAYTRRGFYLPEMAYSRPVAELLASLGFQWIILDEISFGGRLGEAEPGRVYKLKGLDLKVIFRDRIISNSFVPLKLSEISAGDKNLEANIITATDGELYGHRHHDFYGMTKTVFEDGNIQSWKASAYIEKFGVGDVPEIEPIASCWESQEEDVKNNIPFPYWNDPRSELQQKLWALAGFVAEEIEKHREDTGYEIARGRLDKGFSSCHFWAASGKNSSVWQSLIWNPDMVESGNLFFIQALRSISKMDTDIRMEAEARYLEIVKIVWTLHWNRFYGI